MPQGKVWIQIVYILEEYPRKDVPYKLGNRSGRVDIWDPEFVNLEHIIF